MERLSLKSSALIIQNSVFILKSEFQGEREKGILRWLQRGIEDEVYVAGVVNIIHKYLQIKKKSKCGRLLVLWK